MSAMMQVQSLTSLCELRIWCCCKLQHRLQMWLRSSAAMAVDRLQLQFHFSPQPGNTHIPQVQSLNKQANKKVELFYFTKDFFFFFYIEHVFVLCAQANYQGKVMQIFFCVFFRSFIILNLIFKSVIHFELILLQVY